MWIQVCHVKRKDLLNIVFPGGIRPSPPARSASENRSIQRSPGSNSPQAHAFTIRKRKQEEGNKGVSLEESSSISDATSLDEIAVRKRTEMDPSGTANNAVSPDNVSDNGPEIPGLGHSTYAVGPLSSGALPLSLIMEKNVADQSSAQTINLQTEENVADQSSAQSINRQASEKIFDGLTDAVQSKGEIQSSGEAEEVEPLPSFTSEKAAGVASSRNGVNCSMIQQNVDLEELEPLELPISAAMASPAANMAAPKPLIKFSFTSLHKATGKSA